MVDYTNLPSSERENEESNFDDSITKLELTEYQDDQVQSSTSTGAKEEIDSDIYNTTSDSTLCHVITLLVKRGVPVCAGFFFMFLNGFITMSSAGHLNDESIFAGISLAIMFASVTFLSLVVGMSSAIDTLGSQNYGAGNYREVGIVLQRSIAVCMAIAIPMLSLWFYSKSIFLRIGVTDEVATVIQNYLQIRIFSVPLDIVLISYEKYLSAIGVVDPPVYSNITQNITLALCNYLFFHVYRFHYTFLGWSWVIASFVAGVVGVSVSLRYTAVTQTLQPLDREAFHKWWEFISLGVPATLMICSEWWAFEILTFMASQLGTSEVAAQTIMLQTGGLAYMAPLGLGVSTSSLVGNFIGAGKKDVAIKIGKLAMIFEVIMQSSIGLIIYLFGHYFVAFYTTTSSIYDICLNILPFMAFFTVIDGFVSVGSGILKGTGKQQIGAVTNIISFYGIGLPMAYFICFHTSFEVRGLMMGISCGTLCQTFILLYIILCREDYVYQSMISNKDIKEDMEGLTARTVEDDQATINPVLTAASIEIRSREGTNWVTRESAVKGIQVNGNDIGDYEMLEMENGTDEETNGEDDEVHGLVQSSNKSQPWPRSFRNDNGSGSQQVSSSKASLIIKKLMGQVAPS